MQPYGRSFFCFCAHNVADLKFQEHKSFEKLRTEIEGSNISLPKKESNGMQKISDFDQYPKYPVSTLQKENDQLPPKINPLHKEVRFKI